jgi:hypothetical protein
MVRIGLQKTLDVLPLTYMIDIKIFTQKGC